MTACEAAQQEPNSITIRTCERPLGHDGPCRYSDWAAKRPDLDYQWTFHTDGFWYRDNVSPLAAPSPDSEGGA